MGPGVTRVDDAGMTLTRSPYLGGNDLPQGAVLVTTRPVKALVDSRLGQRSKLIESGVRLTHTGTTRFGEPDTELEYAGIHLLVLDGKHAGTTIILWTFDNAQPVDVPMLVAIDHGLTSV